MQVEQAATPPKMRPRAVLRPLAITTYLLRNAGKTIPLTIAIILSVMLVAGIIAMINSIPLSIKTTYGYSQQMLGIGPRGDPSGTPKLIARVKAGSPVPVDKTIVCRVSSANVRSIVGKWPFVVIGMPPEDMGYYLKRLKGTTIEGRLPESGQAEALVSEPVARNLRLKIGSTLIGPTDAEAYSPNEVKVVGIAKTENWLMLTSKEYLDTYHFPPVDVALVFAKNIKDQGVLDRWAEEEFKGERAQIFAYHQIERQSNDMFETLYKILNVVIGTLVVVVTFMMGMLMNIYQSQRLVEFGLLQALGYTRRQLVRRVTAEAVSVVIAGWVLGVFVAYLLLRAVGSILMHPNAFALDAVDRAAFLYTLPIPIAILGAALVTVALRFRNFDPVSVVERRLV